MNQIKQKITEIGLSQREISKRLGKNASYLAGVFRSGLSTAKQAELLEKLEIVANGGFVQSDNQIIAELSQKLADCQDAGIKALESYGIVQKQLTKTQTATVYASEADLLNVALFGMTATQWRQANPDQSGNMRDTATLEQLVVLSNMESINAVLIHQGLSAPERLTQLNAIAITQMRSLVGLGVIKQLGKLPER